MLKELINLILQFKLHEELPSQIQLLLVQATIVHLAYEKASLLGIKDFSTIQGADH